MGKRLIQDKLYVNRDTIKNFRSNLFNEVNNGIEMIIYQVPGEKRSQKWFTNDLDFVALKDFHKLIKNPKSGYKTLSIILYNGRHYTSLIRQSEEKWIYFDASSGIEKNVKGDIVLYNMDNVKKKLKPFNIQTILYIEKTM